VKRSLILERLPDVFKEGATPDNPLFALIGVMEELHARDEDILSGFGEYLDPRRTTDPFVPYLAGWVDLAWLLVEPPDDPYAEPGTPFAGGLGALRELVAAAARNAKWRGTAAGLVRMLETATGEQGYRVEETVTDKKGRPLPFHIRVFVPGHAVRFLNLATRIVEHEKPAHVIADVVLEQGSS
jgi:phage tail-like protein